MLSAVGAFLSACLSDPGVQTPSDNSPEPVVVDGGVIALDPQMERPDALAVSAPLPGFQRGINLGNCLEAPSEGAWGTTLSAKHFEMAAAAGFDHVRLPVRFTTAERSDPNPPYAIKDAFWKRVDWAVDQALANKLAIIVDLHHFEEIHTAPEANKARFYALWRQISERYADRPASVAFEILNEPNGALSTTILNEITAEAIRIIREKNPTRIIMADCYFWAGSDYLKDLELPADDANLVGHFHMYQPMLFTHQGASWMDGSYQNKGVIFPGPPASPIKPNAAALAQSWMADFFRDYNTQPLATNPSGPITVYAHFDNASRFVQRTGKRVYLGEFGAIDQADAQSRANYTWLIRTEAERRGMGWAYWDDGGGFRAMNTTTGTWNDKLKRALLE
jgi:endoglucanase